MNCILRVKRICDLLVGCAQNHCSFPLVVEGLSELSGCNEIGVHKGLIELITKNAFSYQSK